MSKFTLILDSTQLSNAAACEAMWFFGDRQRLLRTDIAEKLKRDDKSARDMGSLFHKYAERYYKAIADKADQTQALRHALVIDMDQEHCECGSPRDRHTPELLNCPERSPGKFTPVPFPLNADKRIEVANKFSQHIYVWAAKGDFEIPSAGNVEVGFSELLYEDSERIFILEGRIDLCNVIYQGSRVAVDHKLQLRRKDLYMKRIQFRNYDLVTRPTFFVVNYVRMAKEANQESFIRPAIGFTEVERRWWKGELIKIYDRIFQYLTNDKLPAQNWGNCETGNGYYTCQFSPLCEESYLGPQLMSNRIDQLYQIRPEWKPW